jgi:hypothetical protein
MGNAICKRALLSECIQVAGDHPSSPTGLVEVLLGLISIFNHGDRNNEIVVLKDIERFCVEKKDVGVKDEGLLRSGVL